MEVESLIRLHQVRLYSYIDKFISCLAIIIVYMKYRYAHAIIVLCITMTDTYKTKCNI